MPSDLPTFESVIGGMAPVGIVIALVGAIFLALGAQFQHKGVEIVEARHGSGVKAGLSPRQMLRLASSIWWIGGTVLLGLAIVFQLTSLGLAPIIVVQPLGVVALVITAIVNARVSKVRLDRHAIRAIVLCVAGIALFVTFAAIFARDSVVERLQLIVILIILGVVLVSLAVAFAYFRKRLSAIFYILAAGVLYGFVATLAKVVINRIGNEIAGVTAGGGFEWLTIVCMVALVLAAALGAYFVQTAYSVGSPDLVIAGLTVVDPLVAVAIGIAVLGEARQVPLWALAIWIVGAGVAIYGVFQLAKHHPQTHRQDNLVEEAVAEVVGEAIGRAERATAARARGHRQAEDDA